MRLMVRPHHTARPPLLVASALLLSLLFLFGAGVAACRRSEPDVTPDELHKELRSIAQLLRLHHEKLLLMAKTAAAPGAFQASRDAIKVLGGREAKLIALLAAMPSTREVHEIRANVVQNFYADRDKLSSAIHDEVTKCRTLEAERRQPISHIGIAIICLSHLAGLVGVAWSAPSPPSSSPVLPSSSAYSSSYYYSSSSSSSPSSSASFSDSTRADPPSSVALIAPTLAGTFAYTLPTPPSSPPPSPPGSSSSSSSCSLTSSPARRVRRVRWPSGSPPPSPPPSPTGASDSSAAPSPPPSRTSSRPSSPKALTAASPAREAAHARRLSLQPARYVPAAFGRRSILATAAAAAQSSTIVTNGEPPATFVASAVWTGAIDGKVFKRGAFGVGYYDDGPIAACGEAIVGQRVGTALSFGAVSISMRPCQQDCDCARCIPRHADARRARFAGEAALPPPPLPTHRITVAGGNVNKTDVVEKTLAFAIRQLDGADKLTRPRDLLNAGLLKALSALGVHDGALDDYDALLALFHERQAVNRAAVGCAAAVVVAAAAATSRQANGAHSAAAAASERSRDDPEVVSVSAVAGLKRKVAAAVRTLGECTASSARAAAVAIGGLHAGSAFDKAAQERDAAAAVASMVAAAVTAEDRTRSAAAARVGSSHETQAEIGMRVYCKLELLEGQLPHEAWRLAVIRGLFFVGAGEVEAFVEFIVIGARWSLDDYPYVAEWSADALKTAAARERDRPALKQHNVTLGRMLAFVGLKAVVPPPRPALGVALNRLPSDTIAAVGATGDAGNAVTLIVYDGRAARATALHRVLQAYAYAAAGFATACLPTMWEWRTALCGSCSAAQWLVAHFLHSIGWSDVVDGLAASAALARFKRVLPWQMIADALADLCETDVCVSVQAPMTLGQIIGCTGKALGDELLREAMKLPLQLEQLRSDGTISAAVLDWWLRDAASFIVKSKYKFAEVLAARAAKQQPALPRLPPGACWMARQAKAYKMEVALSDAKFLLERLRREAKTKAEGIVPTSATAPRAVIEVQRRRACLVWNPGGVHVIDARADRRVGDRERAMQGKRRASGAGAQADVRDRELAAAIEREDEEDGGGDVGRGSALRFKGCDALEAIIDQVKSKDAHLLVLSETHLHGRAVDDVADYLGTRLGWQDLAKGRSGGAPEYVPCVVQAPAARGEWAGVLVAFDPTVFKKLDVQIVVPGRVLQIEFRMVDDSTNLTLFACYMPQANLPREVHDKAWGKLEEALLTVCGAYVIAGDLNAETATRLLKAHKINLSKGGVVKRPGETYLFKLMHGTSFLEFDQPTRVGREEYTHLHVVSAASKDAEGNLVEAVTSKHVIDHVLEGGCDGRVGGGETFTVKVGSEPNKQYHRALGFAIITTDTEEIVTSANRKPKLSKMPRVSSKPKTMSKTGSDKRDGAKLKKRLVTMANALPDRFEDGTGGLVDDAELGVDDSDLEEVLEGDGDADELIGWDAYKERAASASESAMKDWVAGREGACAEAMQQLVGQGRPIDERSRALARDEAAARYAATNGTCVEHLMQACMLVAREVIAAPQAAKGRKQSAGEVLRRKLDKYLAIEKEVEDLKITDIVFGYCGKIKGRWRTRESALTPELKQFFLRDAAPHAPGERKARELVLIRRRVDECVREVEEHRLTTRVDYVNEQLTILAARELGYARAAAEVIRAERRGLMSSKDKGPGGTLVALEDEATGLLLTGVARDKAVAAKVRSGNTPNLVCLESAGHLMDLCRIERGERRGGSTAQGSGAAFQVVEDAECRLGRQPRIARNRERVEACVRPPAGDFVVVGNARFPDEAHDGRVRYDGSRKGILGSPFRMGLDGRDENLRDLSCECYREWLETGGDAYAIAVAKCFPIECVAPGHGRICSADIEAEIESLVEIVVELDKRLVLECGCAPKRCHLACIAEKCNTLIRAKRALRSKQAADARDAGGAAACEQCGEGVVQEGGGAADADALLAKVVADAVAQKGDVSGFVEAGTAAQHHVTRDEESSGQRADEATHEGSRGAGHATEADSARERARERDAWHEELRSVIGATGASDGDKASAFDYWTGEYQLEFNESGDRCTDQRARALLQRLLTPERVLELTKLVKEKLATGLDEFNLVLVKQGGLELAKLFADACVEEVAVFSFPTSWTTWHATLIPKPGKDRCKLSGWREIWIQSHLWKLVVGAILPECAEVFARTRPWCNAGFEAGRGCPEQSAALRARLELHMRLRQPLHVYFQDYSVFFPSISRQLVAFILHELGVSTVSMQILREVQDQVMGAFKTAGGPTELAPMLRGEPIGGVESPLFSLPVAALVQRALETYVPGSPLPDRRELRVAALQLWYADDGALADAVEGIIQTAVDIMILLSEEILGLKVGHDTVEASKSASLSWTWDKSRNEFVRGNGNKFKVPLGSSREDIELARAITYRYLGIDFDPELDVTKVEESYRARASAIITMINNLGGGYCDQLAQAVNTVVQGVFIFPARTIPFTEVASKALDIKATKLLFNHGNRARHSKIVGAYVAGKYGGLGLRPGRSTMAAGLLDEMARAWGGRRGEPARAVRLSLQTVFVASLGWDGPSAEAPTVFDFIINERWLPCFRSEVPMEGVALHMARLGLRWRGTGVDECRLDKQRAIERGVLPGRKVRLIELLGVTPSLRLHGLGISSLDELHAGGGELLSAERIEVIYARPGWAWSDVDRAHVRRLLREVAGNDRAKVALDDWREHGAPMGGEIALIERINVGRRSALRMFSRIVGIMWCKDAEGGRPDERSYEVIFCGARLRDAVWLTRAQVLEGAARRDAATTVCSPGEPIEIDEVTAWMDEADASRWEPSTFNRFLTRLRGPQGAAELLAKASRAAGLNRDAAQARVELTDVLLLDYAALRAKGVSAKEVNLREDRIADEARRHEVEEYSTAWTITCTGALRQAHTVEERMGAVRAMPVPTYADGGAVPESDVQVAFDGVAWKAAKDNGSLWSGWRGPNHKVAEFERAPAAFASAVTRSFSRAYEAERSPEGLTCVNAYGGLLQIRIARDEAALIASDLNLALLREIGKIEMVCKQRGRGGFKLVAATDGAYCKAKALSARDALRYELASDAERVQRKLRAPYEPPQVASGVFYGLQAPGSAVPVAEGRRLPAEFDNNQAELDGLILALRRHVALLTGISVHEVLRRLLHDCEYAIGPAASADEGEDELDAMSARDGEADTSGPREARDLLIIIDSEIIASFFQRAWRRGDIKWLRGETYGLRMEEAILLRIWLRTLGAEVHTLRLSSHCGFIPNVWADAIANAARLLDCDGEPPLVVRRPLAFLCKVGGDGKSWRGPGASLPRSACGMASSSAELDARTSKEIRELSDTCALHKLVENDVKVFRASRQGREARDEIDGIVFLPRCSRHAQLGEQLLDSDASKQAKGLFEQARHELRSVADGELSAELIEGRLYAAPFFDYVGVGLDVTKGMQIFDRRIQTPLSTQRGGGFGGPLELTRVGMRHLLRNFTQSALPELGDGIDDSARVAGETLPLCRCPVCRRECRCDLFHFFECPHGLSEAARVACCSALEQHASMIGAPRAGDGEGEGDLHLELAWARVALLAERLPGELGRYRRYLAAKALAGAFALPAASSVKEAVMDSLRAGVSVSTAEADEADDGDGDNGDTQDEWEEARPPGEFDYEQCAGARRDLLKWYVGKAIALNTVIIDHLRIEYSAWVESLRRGHAGLRGAYGSDYMSHFLGGRERVCDEQLRGTFFPTDGSVAVPMSLADFKVGHKSDEMRPGRFVRIVGGETIACTHGTAASRYEAQASRRASAKAAADLAREEGSFRYARLEQERELGELVERRIERGFENLAEPDEEERALLLDGGRERAALLMREASAVGARAWLMPDGGGAAGTAQTTDCADECMDEGGVDAARAFLGSDPDDMDADDAPAPPLQATQSYGAAHDDDEDDAEADEAVRRAPTWHATQQYDLPQMGDDDEDYDEEAVRRSAWPDAPMAESPRALAARWAACGLEMDDELSGESSATRKDVECMSDMMFGDAHDVLASSMDVAGAAQAQVAEREQQREKVSVGCAMRDDVGAGGSGSGAARALEGGDDGVVTGCVGVDGAEQEASMAACEAEGDDEYEVTAGDENVSMQRPEGGSGSTSGIKKRGHRGGTKEFKAGRRKPNKYGYKAT